MCDGKWQCFTGFIHGYLAIHVHVLGRVLLFNRGLSPGGNSGTQASTILLDSGITQGLEVHLG